MLTGCEDCQTSYVGECTKHRLQPVTDKVILSRAWASLPVVLQIFRLSDTDSTESAGRVPAVLACRNFVVSHNQAPAPLPSSRCVHLGLAICVFCFNYGRPME